MPKKQETPKKTARKSLKVQVASVARKAKKSVKAVLAAETPAPPSVEIEPQPLESPEVRALKRERARLLHDLKHQTLLAQDRPSTGNHMADDASEVEAQTKAMALRRHIEGMLQEIEHAIVRAEKGTYGICERCKQPIPEDRLKVMPSATLCITCAKLQTNHLSIKAAV